MLNLMLHRLQPFHGAVNFILAQLYVGVYTSTMAERKAPRTKRELAPESEAWRTLPWHKLEQHAYRIQKRIYRASQRGNQRAVHKLQKLLMKSEAPRLLAVRRATQYNQGTTT